jgi:hypothetical protein
MTTVTNNLYGLEIRFCVDRVYLFYWLPCLKVTCNVCHGFAAIIHLNDMCMWEHIVDIHIQCIHFITMPQPLIIVKYTCKLILAWPRILIPLIGVLKIELWIFPLICGDIISALLNCAAASFEGVVFPNAMMKVSHNTKVYSPVVRGRHADIKLLGHRASLNTIFSN